MRLLFQCSDKKATLCSQKSARQLSAAYRWHAQTSFSDGLDCNVQVTIALDELSRDYPIDIPPYFALILRAFSVIEGTALRVDPNYAIVKETFPYLSRRLLTDDQPRARAALRQLLYGVSLLSLIYGPSWTPPIIDTSVNLFAALGVLQATQLYHKPCCTVQNTTWCIGPSHKQCELVHAASFAGRQTDDGSSLVRFDAGQSAAGHQPSAEAQLRSWQFHYQRHQKRTACCSGSCPG